MRDFSDFKLWQPLDQALGTNRRPGSASDYRTRLAKVLKPLDGVELARFIHELAHLLDALRTQRHWVAASLRLGRLADDEEFAHLRNWVIAHGHEAYAGFLNDPDSLALLDPDQQSPFLAPLSATPLKLYGVLEAQDAQLNDRVDDALGELRFEGEWDLHIGWEYWKPPGVADLQRDFPRLWRRYGAQWHSGRPDRLAATPGLAGFVKQAAVEGLGLVKCGDRINIEGSEVEIIGISDMHAMLAEPDSVEQQCDIGDGFRYVARVREADGSTRCNQLLSAEFLKRIGPSQFQIPDWTPVEIEEDEELEAWEAADGAIQERLQQALESEPEVRIRFAAYDEDDNGLPIDNLDDVAYVGTVQFEEIDEGDGECYTSARLSNPTWIDIARAANTMLLTLNYTHHVYLEGIEVSPGDDEADLGEFLLGS